MGQGSLLDEAGQAHSHLWLGRHAQAARLWGACNLLSHLATAQQLLLPLCGAQRCLRTGHPPAEKPLLSLFMAMSTATLGFCDT